MNSRSLILLFLCLSIASCGWRKGGQEPQVGDNGKSWYPDIEAGARAPKFEIKDTVGNSIKLSAMKGSFVVLDFWASFCPDCRAEFPAVKALYDKYSPKGIKFIGISFDDKEEDWKDCLKEEQFPFPQGSNLVKWKENPINEAYGIRWIPTLMLISPEGTVICTALTASDMDAAIEKTVHFR